MKFTSLVIALICSFSFVQAQETMPVPKQKKPRNNNEIGIMTDYAMGNTDQTMNLLGIQYKHWNNKTVAYRIAFGSGRYFDQGNERFLPSGSLDTVYSRRINYELPMACLAIGVEVQRKFYRKLFFYGALELKGGYGKGNYDSVYTKRDVYNTYTYSDAGRESKTGSGYYAAFSPAFGLKLNFRKWVIGTEFSSLMQFVSKETPRGGRDGDFNFDLGNINQRLYINYRFR